MYSLYYSAGYFGFYVWFISIIFSLIGITCGLMFAICQSFVRTSAISQFGLNIVLSLIIYSVTCKWSLEEAFRHNYKFFQGSFPNELIKLKTAILFQEQSMLVAFIASHISTIFGTETSDFLKVVIEFAVMLIANYFIVIRWISKNAKMTPKNSE